MICESGNETQKAKKWKIMIIIIIIIIIINNNNEISIFKVIFIFKVNILHPITVFSFCHINVDSEGLKFSCNNNIIRLYVIVH